MYSGRLSRTEGSNSCFKRLKVVQKIKNSKIRAFNQMNNEMKRRCYSFLFSLNFNCELTDRLTMIVQFYSWRKWLDFRDILTWAIYCWAVCVPSLVDCWSADQIWSSLPPNGTPTNGDDVVTRGVQSFCLIYFKLHIKRALLHSIIAIYINANFWQRIYLESKSEAVNFYHKITNE